MLDLAGLPLSDSHRERKRLMELCKGRYYSCKEREEILAFHRRLIDFGRHGGPLTGVAHPPSHCSGIARVAHGGEDGANWLAPVFRLEVLSPLSMPEPHVAARARTLSEPRRRSLSVVVPMLNEERGLEPLVDRLRPVLESLGLDWEIIFVDDGSTDGTLAKLKALNAQDRRLKAISLSRNFGKEIATAAGLSYAGGDAAVLMDADLQHPPELIRDFVAAVARGLRHRLRAAHRSRHRQLRCTAGPRAPSMPPSRS